MNTKEAVNVLKSHNEWRRRHVEDMPHGPATIGEAIDTVVAEVEKPLPSDEELKELGFLTYRVMLRQLNCGLTKDKVTFSMKELRHWFETGQHLKEWKEWDTI